MQSFTYGSFCSSVMTEVLTLNAMSLQMEVNLPWNAWRARSRSFAPSAPSAPAAPVSFDVAVVTRSSSMFFDTNMVTSSGGRGCVERLIWRTMSS